MEKRQESQCKKGIVNVTVYTTLKRIYTSTSRIINFIKIGMKIWRCTNHEMKGKWFKGWRECDFIEHDTFLCRDPGI